MTYEQLRVLQAIVDTGTFRAAAEQVSKSQPAVSSLIRKLEKELGITLFSRNSYRPSLTKEGQIFQKKAQLAVRQFQQLSHLAQRLSNKEEDTVRIAVNVICPLPHLLTSVQAIEAAYAEADISLFTESVSTALEKLKSQEVDLAITTRIDADETNLEALPFSRVIIIPVAASDSGLVRNLAKEGLQNHAEIIVGHHGEEDESMDVLSTGKVWVVGDFATKKDIILSGLGWGGLPEHLIQSELREGRLVKLEVPGVMERTVQLYLVRATNQTQGPATEALWDALASPII